MIPYYPQNTKQLQQQGLLDLGMRLLSASGPQHAGMGLGPRFGQAGIGNLEAMRNMGMQMQQMEALRGKQNKPVVVGAGAHMVTPEGQKLYATPHKPTAGGESALKPADENYIRKLTIERYGGIMDEMGNVRALDKSLRGDVLEVTKMASRIWADGLLGTDKKRTRSESVEEAYRRYNKSKNDPFNLR